MIDHGENHARYAGPQHHAHGRIRRRELDGVRQQIRDHLQQAIGIARDLRSRGVVQQLHAGGIGHRLHIFNGLLHDIRQLHRAEGQRFAPALNALQIENVVDQSHQPVGVGEGNAQQVRSLLVHVAQHSRRQQSQCPANRSQRRAQLVAHRGDELILHPIKSVALADVAKTQYPAGKAAVPTDGRQHIFSREGIAIGAEEVLLTGRRGGSCRGLAQRAILAAGAVGGRGSMQQLMQ